MERPRALPLRSSALILGLSFGAFISGCNPKIEELPKTRSKRDTLGQEIYKVLCRRVAGTEIPNDIDGSETEVLCLGDQQSAESELKARRTSLPPRLVALAERRRQIAEALNEGFPDDTASGIEDLMRSLLPFYDPPEEVLQEGTRRTAAMLQRLVKNRPALEAMARFGREGMVPPEGDFGVTRAALGYRRVADVLATVLPALTTEALAPAFSAALKGAALELATSELETDPDSDTCHTRDLFSRSEKLAAGEASEFSSGTPLYTAARDVRGMPIPKRDKDEGSVELLSACGTGGEVRPVPYPFVDANQDGFADINGVNFSLDPSFSGVLPEPFEVVGETAVERDAYGRAYGLVPQGSGAQDQARNLYVTRDADASLLAASLRVAAHAFAPNASLLENLAGALPALLGDSKQTTRSYEQATHTYMAPDPDRSPLVAALHASSVLTADPLTDESAELSQKLLREHEPALMKSFEPLFALERRTRPGQDDAYPDAHLEPKNTFWNEILWEAEKMSRRRNEKDGETLLEATMRASLGFGRNFGKPGAPTEQLVDAELLSRQGSILAMMMRFKDEWRGNPRLRDERPAGDSDIIGTLNTPVDRTKPPTPVSCGTHGCGGSIIGTPFERWRLAGNSTCVIPIPGAPQSGRDCGAPANQSILHRSMGLLAELAGRTQCNRPITVRDLFDFAASSQQQTPAEMVELENTVRDAEKALAEDYTCPTNQPSAACRAYAQRFPSAFVARTGDSGPLPPAIQECGLLDLADVGRTFGRVMTHEYQLEVPNPWVRRYLEDVARAADGSLPTCAPGVITDPKNPPLNCVTNAAKLSRGVFEELPACSASDPTCVDTLSELIEFLLDDKGLFQSAQDERELRPDARTLTRVLFAPAGASEGFQLFDPLLVANAPSLCSKSDTRPRCNLNDTKTEEDGRCCIASLEDAPMRFRLDTYYGATTYAWEHMFKFKDGKQLSFLDAGVSISDAFNRLDIPAGAVASDYEDQNYIFTNLGNLLALHYDSPENIYVQGLNPKLPGYRKLTGLVRYEELLADLFDDGSLDLKQKGPHGREMFPADLSFTPDQQLAFLAKSLDLLLALDAMSFHGGDGISALARSTESMLNPHAWCAGEGGDKRIVAGRGACDATSPARPPIAARDGRDYACYRDGTCFDGKTPGVAKRFVSSVDLLLDALWDIDDRRRADPKLKVATRALLGDVLDAFSAIENSRLKDRRLRAASLVTGDYARERWADEKAKGTLATFGQRNVDDFVDALTNPLVAAGLDVLRGLSEQDGALPTLQALLFALLDERSEPSAARAFLSFSADALQSMPGDASANALAKSLAFAAAPNIDDVLSGKDKELDVEGSVAWNNVFTLGETGKADSEDVLEPFLGAMVGARKPDPNQPAPLTVLYDALIDINRVDPLANGQHDAADYAEAFTRIADVMLDKRRGFERMYQLVRCSNHPKDPICD